jgi:uncharacterized protein (DUF427 family)
MTSEPYYHSKDSNNLNGDCWRMYKKPFIKKPIPSKTLIDIDQLEDMTNTDSNPHINLYETSNRPKHYVPKYNIMTD